MAVARMSLTCPDCCAELQEVFTEAGGVRCPVCRHSWQVEFNEANLSRFLEGVAEQLFDVCSLCWRPSASRKSLEVAAVTRGTSIRLKRRATDKLWSCSVWVKLPDAIGAKLVETRAAEPVTALLRAQEKVRELALVLDEFLVNVNSPEPEPSFIDGRVV